MRAKLRPAERERLAQCTPHERAWKNWGPYLSERQWTEEEVAARIYLGRPAAATILQALQRQQLVTQDSGSAGYRYNPQWDPSGEVMPEVAAAYSRHLVHLATFIHSRASTAVREFARAFDLKKDR